MKRIENISRKDWETYCQRPALSDEKVRKTVQDILKNVLQNGDAALRNYSLLFDQTEVDFFVSEVPKAEISISAELKQAIQLAAANIQKFHATQINLSGKSEIMPGVDCWWEKRPIQKVGLYIPGGSAPLFSTFLMLGIPAIMAGCSEIAVCTPPDKDGQINPVILYTAQLLRIPRIYKIGGAQAIAAMAYGSQSIPKVDKIFGPGNQYVTQAKQLVQQDQVAIDMPAGPSEVLIIADDSSNPVFVAADLLSQSEHGPDSQVVLLSNSKQLLNEVSLELEKQLKVLPRKDIAQKSLENSLLILMKDIPECIAFSNQYAPEHLILAFDEAENYAEDIINAGSVFIGHYSCESAGDYASGTNHTLPTSAYAKAYSGVTLDSFQKSVSFQKITGQGLSKLGPAIIEMANAEGLKAHANAVSIRLKQKK